MIMRISRLTFVNLIIAVVLLSSPFMVQLTSSAKYDPWADLDDDGDIDIFDIVAMAGRYDTKGDSTKNVVVDNWPTTQDVNVVSLPVHSTVMVADGVFVDTSPFNSPEYNAQGFGKIHVMILISSIQFEEEFVFEIRGRLSSTISWAVYSFALNYQITKLAFTFDVPSETFSFRLDPEGTDNCFLGLSFYMTLA